MSGPDPQETWRRLQKTLQTQRSRFGAGGGGMPGGGNPRNALGGLAGILLLGGAVVVVNNSLFNGILSRQTWGRGIANRVLRAVDGGHRAIKYTRIGGVGKEIYSEGIFTFKVAFVS